MKVWVIYEKYSACFSAVFPEEQGKRAEKYATKHGDSIILYDMDATREFE